MGESNSRVSTRCDHIAECSSSAMHSFSPTAHPTSSNPPETIKGKMLKSSKDAKLNIVGFNERVIYRICKAKGQTHKARTNMPHKQTLIVQGK